MDKERRMLYTILGALVTVAAAAAVVFAFKKRKCAEKKLIDEIDDIVSAKCGEDSAECADESDGEKCEKAGQSDDCKAAEPEKSDCECAEESQQL